MLVKFYLIYGNLFLCEARWYLNPFGHWHLYPFCTLSLTSVSSKAIHWPPFSQLRSSSCILVWFLPFSTLLESFCSFLGEQFHVTLRIISSCKIDSSVILKMVYKSKIIINVSSFCMDLTNLLLALMLQEFLLIEVSCSQKCLMPPQWIALSLLA